MAANVSSPSVYSLHAHTEGWGELHFILQGWKVLAGEPCAWGGWGSRPATRGWEGNCLLHLQGSLEETCTQTNFIFHLHIIYVYHVLPPFSLGLPFLCLYACSTYRDDLPSTFVTLRAWEKLSVLQHHSPCEAQRSWTNSPSNTSFYRDSFSVVSLSHVPQVCVQPCTLAVAYWGEEGCRPL